MFSSSARLQLVRQMCKMAAWRSGRVVHASMRCLWLLQLVRCHQWILHMQNLSASILILLQLSPLQVDQLIERMDLNQDGNIAWDEFSSALVDWTMVGPC